MPRTNSLSFRLIAIAAVWSLLGLIAGGFALSSVFRRSAENSFDNRLLADVENVIAVAELGVDGAVKMPQPLVDPRFLNPFSGWYWQIAPAEQAPGAPRQSLRSRSLWDQSLALGPPEAQGEVRKDYVTGPKKQRLRYVERVISLPAAEADPTPVAEADRRFRVAVAGDVRDVEADIEEFNATLIWAIVILGVGLIGAMVVVVRLGLAPLRQVSQSLAAIREGRADRLVGDFPAEIQPLADELNALVAHNEEVVARARTHVGNLAHFLKTPLSVLANEVQGSSGTLAETVARQIQVMRRQVDHYLARARTVGSAAVIGARTEAAPVVADLTRALSKIYARRGIRIESQCASGVSFRGDRSDLEEMIGNLLDNACKWADGEVTIAVSSPKPGRISVVVGDDGPGLDDEQKRRVIEKGERLDESKPGSGLGLGIVKEIASLYGGKLTLGRAEAGGLGVELDLPAADRAA